MAMLEKLVEKPQMTFKFKPIKVYEAYERVDKSKSTNSSSKDGITMRILKDCPQFTSRVITHLYNSIIHTNTYPSILKISNIVPICKPGKDSDNITSFIPISILATVDKLIQGILKDQMEDYFETNNYIPNQHHGRHKLHSTISAMSSIDYIHKEIKE